jgi:hypothetical protein
MGNSTSALAGVVEKLMVDGDVSDLADEAWETILGGGDQPLMSPKDVRLVFGDELLRTARSEKPRNLLAVILRAVERVEAALEPDTPKEDTPCIGATVAPRDVPTVLACVRLLSRIVPFIAAAVDDSSGNDEPSASPADPTDEPPDVCFFSRTVWGETETAPLARALPWRKHRALVVSEDADACDARSISSQTMSKTSSLETEEETKEDETLSKNEKEIVCLGERLVALFCDLLFCPGFTVPLRRSDVERSDWWLSDTAREHADACVSTLYARTSHEETPRSEGVPADDLTDAERLAFATRRKELLRYLLAMTASEAMYTPPRVTGRTRKFLDAFGGGAEFTGVWAGRAVTREDIFNVLVEGFADRYEASGTRETPLSVVSSERRTKAAQCLLTLLDYEPFARASSTSGSTVGGAARDRTQTLAVSSYSNSTSSWFRWLDDLFGGFSLWRSLDDALGIGARPTHPGADATSRLHARTDAGTTPFQARIDASPRLEKKKNQHENAYAKCLASFTDHASLHDAFLDVFRAAIACDIDHSDTHESIVPCFEEAAAFFTHCARCNASFFEYCVSPAARHGVPLAFCLLGLAVRHRGAMDKGGFLQCVAFAVLRLSSAEEFARALASDRDPNANPELELVFDPSLEAETKEKDDSSDDDAFGFDVSDSVSDLVSSAFGFSTGFSWNTNLWRGTHLDAFIHVAYRLLTECDRQTSASLSNPLLTALKNVVPFAANASTGSCARLIRLVERYASRALLLAQPDTFEDHIRFLTDAIGPIDAIVTLRAKANPNLVAALREKESRDVFQRLDGLGEEASASRRDVEASESDFSEASETDDAYDSEVESDADVAFRSGQIGEVRSVPSKAWFRALQNRLPLDAILKTCAGDASASRGSKTTGYTVYRFTGASPEIREWLRGYALGVVFLREAQVNADHENRASETLAPLFDARRVRLFRVVKKTRRA